MMIIEAGSGGRWAVLPLAVRVPQRRSGAIGRPGLVSLSFQHLVSVQTGGACGGCCIRLLPGCTRSRPCVTNDIVVATVAIILLVRCCRMIPHSSAGPTPSVMATVGARVRVVAADRGSAAVLGRSRGRLALCYAALGGHARHRAALERPARSSQDLSSRVGGGRLTAEAGAGFRATVAERVGAPRFSAARRATVHVLTHSSAIGPRDPRSLS
jgi:hypothetical protein